MKLFSNSRLLKTMIIIIHYKQIQKTKINIQFRIFVHTVHQDSNIGTGKV